MTGYSILKVIKESFIFYRRLSPGTFYHQLEKLAKNSDIEQKGEEYIITAQGTEKISESMFYDLKKSTDHFIKPIFSMLVKTLPDLFQLDALSEFPFMPGCSSCNIDMSTFYDKHTPFEKLEQIRDKLLKAKQDLEVKYKREMDSLDEKIKKIDKEIKEEMEKKIIKVKDEENSGNQ